MKVEYIDHMGSDLSVVNAARVSFSKQKPEVDEKDGHLINYLAREKHWSPFSHPKISVRVSAPIFVARQWEKHRVGAVRAYDIYDHSEVSRRYVDSDPEFYFPDAWRRRPDGSIKQGSGAAFDGAKSDELSAYYSDAMRAAEYCYQVLLYEGVAPEQARMVLPQSMYTEWVETGSLAYFARVRELRVDAHAQAEIQELAAMLDPIIGPLFPLSWEALK